MAATQDQTLVQAVDFRNGRTADQTGTLQAKPNGGYSLNYQPGVLEDMGTGYIVRRLMPIETERLMGFPDNWTDLTGCDVDAVTEKVAASMHYDEKQKEALRRKVRKWSKDCPDGPRYKACGNSFAVPVVAWIGERIQMVDGLVGE